jgi:hypothetical protein
MKTRFLQIIGVGLCFLIANLALAQDKPRGTPVTGAELEQLYRNNNGTMMDSTNVRNGARTNTIYLSNGALLSQWVNQIGTGAQDTGTWGIKNNTLCLTFKIATEGKAVCYRIYKVGDNAYESWLADKDTQAIAFRVRR